MICMTTLLFCVVCVVDISIYRYCYYCYCNCYYFCYVWGVFFVGAVGMVAIPSYFDYCVICYLRRYTRFFSFALIDCTSELCEADRFISPYFPISSLSYYGFKVLSWLGWTYVVCGSGYAYYIGAKPDELRMIWLMERFLLATRPAGLLLSILFITGSWLSVDGLLSCYW